MLALPTLDDEAGFLVGPDGGVVGGDRLQVDAVEVAPLEGELDDPLDGDRADPLSPGVGQQGDSDLGMAGELAG